MPGVSRTCGKGPLPWLLPPRPNFSSLAGASGTSHTPTIQAITRRPRNMPRGCQPGPPAPRSAHTNSVNGASPSRVHACERALAKGTVQSCRAWPAAVGQP
jgi:hypothetical protein